MADDGAGMAQQVVEGADQLDLVAGVAQGLDQRRVEAVFQLQVIDYIAPGAAQQPARRGDRLLQALAEHAHGG